MVEEAKLRGTTGLVPDGEGWFIVNVQDAAWKENPRFGKFCAFEGASRFKELGLNVHILDAGQPACMYHHENRQEDFIVLSGTCRVIIEGAERALKQWDMIHCPAGTNHVFVGGVEGPCVILMIGARGEGTTFAYPVNETAREYGASTDEETHDPRVAYASRPPTVDIESPWPLH